MKVRVIVLPLLLACGAVQAAQPPIPVDYQYGMRLDIAKVLDLREPADDYQCKVVVATMTYLDSQGQEQAVNYRKLSQTCTTEG